MKTAVIYYSYDGNCALVAGLMKTALNSSSPPGNADVFEIKTVDSKRREGFFKMLWGGMQAVFNKKPAIQPLAIEIDSYDLLVLGTPVWAGSPAPAMVSFLSEKKFSGRKVALFCCHGGGPGKVFDKLKALLPGNRFAGEIDFINPTKGNRSELEQKIRDWAKSLNQ
jgi:flavodoxin